MSAGIPNYAKLEQLGKLPKEMRHKIAGLAAADKKAEEFEKILNVLCDDCKAKAQKIMKPEAKKEKPVVKEAVKVNCPAHQCEYTAEGDTELLARKNLGLHTRGKHPELVPPETPQANIR